MVTLKFSNFNLFQLNREINLFLNEPVKMTMGDRYKLISLEKVISDLLIPYIKVRNEEILKLDKTGQIPAFIGNQPNPVLLQLDEAMKEVNNIEQSIEVELFDFRIIEKFEPQNQYWLLFQLFTKN